MQALLESFLEHLSLERNLSDHTVKAYSGDLSRFLSFAAEYLGVAPERLDARRIDSPCVRAFVASLARSGLSRKAQGRALSAVRSFFRFLCREEEADLN
ncbi:MAG: site-specific integrase, partial [Thermoanaerobaculia bacterium]|nr:site-specific integrase [Thermoanaerobaculia bacterium]